MSVELVCLSCHAFCLTGRSLAVVTVRGLSGSGALEHIEMEMSCAVTESANPSPAQPSTTVTMGSLATGSADSEVRVG